MVCQWWPVVGALLLIGSACGSPTPQIGSDTPLVVLAASSLTNAFQEVATAFEETPSGRGVLLNFAGTTTLRAQLEHGAQADLFASADERQMGLAQEHGLLAAPPIPFATNRLAVAARRGGPVQTFADLAQPGVQLVLAQREVPAGAYTEQLLAALGRDSAFGASWVGAVRGNVVSREANVRQVLAKVQVGEADAAVVYVTDLVASSGEGVVGLPLPSGHVVEAVYWIAQVKGGASPEVAQAFLAFLRSARGQGLLQRHGFGGPPS